MSRMRLFWNGVGVQPRGPSQRIAGAMELSCLSFLWGCFLGADSVADGFGYLLFCLLSSERRC
jgi:hypothetical protein